MDPNLWKRAEELFHRVASLVSAERQRQLDEACAGDPTLRQAVVQLLEGDESELSVLDLDAEGLVDLVDQFETPERIGRYDISGLIGRGGMGTVYLAERADGRFQRKVALKIVRSGFGSDSLVRRFQAEGRILARLEHENIARLYDAGVDAGRPFLVMEYVEGQRIDHYCDERRLGVNERLELFTHVCEAVQYAHQRFVIHRDIKPSNILISDDGTVKLLDFGVSTLVEEEVDPDSPGTIARAMTVGYSSPEQIRGEPVTAASDVYSLGVVLHELLVGRRPHDAAGSPLDTAMAVVTDDATRPSESLILAGADLVGSATRPIATPDEVAKLRGTTPARLARQLMGDVDTIVLESLQRAPEERYQSAQALLEDIRRHLSGHPVRARPDTVGYRMKKFVRRHTVGVAATLAVVLSLIGGLTAALWQARVASAQRDLARLEAEKSNRVTDFLIDVFSVADPARARADTLTAVQILERGADRVEAELSNEPLVQATMLGVLGRVYASLSLYDRADTLLNRALERRVALLGYDHPDVATTLHNLADLYYLRSDPRADSLYQEAVELRIRVLGQDDPAVGVSLLGLAGVQVSDDDGAADASVVEALRIFQSAPGDQDSHIGRATYSLGYVRHNQGDYQSAERLYREALAIQRKADGPNKPHTLTTAANLGSLLQLLGRYEAADSALRSVLHARRQVFGDSHTRVANSLYGLSELRFAQGDYDGAETYIREALEMREGLYGAASPISIYTRFYLGRILQAKGEFAESEQLFQDALAGAEAQGSTGAAFARLVNGFAGALETNGDLTGAETFYRRAWDLYRASLGETHPFTAIVQGNVAAVLLDQGDLESAEPLFRDAINVMRTAWSDDHQSVGIATMQLGTLQMQKGELEAAEVSLRRGQEVIGAALPSDHWRVGQARMRLGACLVDMGRLGEAEDLLLSSFEILEGHRRARFGDWRQLLSELYELYEATGHSAEAARFQVLFNQAPVPLAR